jgi:hypothetical protein
MKGSWRNIKDISGRYRHARQERRHVFASFKRRINSGRLYVRISPEEQVSVRRRFKDDPRFMFSERAHAVQR